MNEEIAPNKLQKYTNKTLVIAVSTHLGRDNISGVIVQSFCK
jgi:hypothetical protein